MQHGGTQGTRITAVPMASAAVPQSGTDDDAIVLMTNASWLLGPGIDGAWIYAVFKKVRKSGAGTDGRFAVAEKSPGTLVSMHLLAGSPKKNVRGGSCRSTSSGVSGSMILT